MAIELTDAVEPPPHLLASCTTSIPTAEHRGDADGLATRRVVELRLWALMQTAAKLVAYVANHYTSGIAATIVCGEQRGFVRTRYIVNSILELEGMMATFFRVRWAHSGRAAARLCKRIPESAPRRSVEGVGGDELANHDTRGRATLVLPTCR